jgi:hypothetical protein
MIDPVLESSLVVRIGLRTTPEPELFAKVVPPFPADAALSASNTNLEGNSIANAETINSWSNSNYLTRGFMAKRERLAGAEIAVGKLLVVRDV